MRYVDEFLSLKCAPDVLAIAGPLGGKSSKEIAEAIGVVHKIRRITLDDPMQYGVVDIGAGNALASLIAVHLLPVAWATAVDKKTRKRHWEKAKRFKYIEDSISSDTDLSKYAQDDKPFITIGIHTCSYLAIYTIEAWNKCKQSPYLVLVPCCEARQVRNEAIPALIRKKLGSYLSWSYTLFEMVKGKKQIVEDSRIISPKNIIITASKEV